MHPPLAGKTTTSTRPETIAGKDISYHITRLRVPLFEVDLGQAVYHGNYYHLFETAREDYLRKIGFPYREFMNRSLHLTIVQASCTYRRPLHYDDALEIGSAITWMKTRSLGISQVIRREKDAGQRELCTQLQLDMVCVRFSGKPTVLPEDFKTMVENFANNSGIRD